MKLLFEKEVSPDVKLLVYDISCVDADYLKEFGINPLLINSKRQLQTALYKHLVAKYYNVPVEMVVKSQYNKPYIKGHNCYISVSHTENLIAIICSEKQVVGIDIEKISERVLKIAHKFTNREEEKLIDKNDPMISTMVLWCSKEAMYKIYEKRALSFTDNIRLLDYQYNEHTQRLSGWIKNSVDAPIYCTGAYIIFQDFLLVYFIKDQ